MELREAQGNNLSKVTTWAIGDIHGLATALEQVLEQIRSRVAPDDTVVFVGDYIDRGPDSKGCIERILEFRQQVPARVVTLLGNHEQWLLRTRRDHTDHTWLFATDAFTTISSYSRSAAEALRRHKAEAGGELYTDRVKLPYELFFEAMPGSHLQFLDELAPFHRTPEAFLSHGGCNPNGGPLDRQSHHDLVWGSRTFIDAYGGPDFVVYGHWGNAVPAGPGAWLPCRKPFSLGIDTSAHGIVTAVRLPGFEVFQAASR